jgi:predicted RNA-binding protein with RPS1 domain
MLQPIDVQIDLEVIATTPQKPNHAVAIDEKKTVVEADRSTATPKTNPAIVSDEKETVVKEDQSTPKMNPVSLSDKKKTIFEKEEDSSSDSDSDVSLEEATKRQRGRRRRGRQSTEVVQAEGLDKTNEEVPVAVNHDNSKEMMEQPSVEIHGENDASNLKKTPKKDDKRRCIGRKPVTDFVIGQRYSGKVIYIKPFGAFIDIGCHSDAFCHVSRVRDDFVESITEAVNIGDEVSARVVEVDRQAKRVTVSLQSDARIDDERASIEARMQRRGKTKSSSSVTKNNVAEHKKTKLSSVSSNNVVDNTTPAKRESTEEEEPLDESMMTPTQIKRARKLARRAARREHSDETGIAA